MNIFKQLIRSIYSPKDIAMFRFQGIGKTILFVFLLTLISVLPSIVFLGNTLSNGLDTARTIIDKDLPNFNINNGKLSADTDVPIKVTRDNFVVILDPTGTITKSDVTDEGTAFALLKDEFVLASGGSAESSPYSMMQGMKLDRENLVNFIDAFDSIKGIIIPIASVFLYLVASASSFIEVSVLALFGLLIANLLGRKLNYRHAWRMAAYSETLPTIFFAIMAAIKTNVPNMFFLNWFVAIVVLFLAIKEIPQPKKTEKDTL